MNPESHPGKCAGYNSLVSDEHSFWSRRVKPGLDLIQAIGVFLAGIGLILTAFQLGLQVKSESATLGFQFDDRLSKPVMIQIADAIESTPQLPILAPTGKVSGDDLYDYLGNFDSIYYLHKEGLIDDQMIDDLFCADAELAFDDPEIKAFLNADRTPGNKDDYIGFDKLAAYCVQLDHSGQTKVLDQ